LALEVAISAARRCKSGGANWGRLLGLASPPIHLTPATGDRSIAADWFRRFETAGVDYDKLEGVFCVLFKPLASKTANMRMNEALIICLMGAPFAM